MEHFLVKDYRNRKKSSDKPKLEILDTEKLLNLLDKLRREDTPGISVYRIGECLLDWS